MDNLTHTLFAVTLGRTPLGRAGRGTTTALVLASNAPDIDVVTAARGGASYLQWHRGPTHGPLGVVGLAAATAAIVWVIQRVADRSATKPDDDMPSASFAMLLAVSAVGVLGHILMDFPTSYGTRLFSPFSWTWFAADLMPIVDVYLVGALAAGLLFGSSEAARRRNAAIVLALMAANYGIRIAARHEAIALAPRVFGPLMPQPCDPGGIPSPLVAEWPRPAAQVPLLQAMPGGASRCLADVAAIPMFSSPFKWRLIARLSNAYELHDVDVLDPRLRRPAEPGEATWRVTVRYPDQWTPAVTTAATAPVAQTFLGFSRYPAARWAADPRTGVVTVRWTDMRFATGMPMDQRIVSRNLFEATVRVAPDDRLLDQRLGQ